MNDVTLSNRPVLTVGDVTIEIEACEDFTLVHVGGTFTGLVDTVKVDKNEPKIVKPEDVVEDDWTVYVTGLDRVYASMDEIKDEDMASGVKQFNVSDIIAMTELGDERKHIVMRWSDAAIQKRAAWIDMTRNELS